MQVLQILKEKADDGVVTVMPGSTVEQAMKLLASRRIGAVVVSPDGKAVAGIVSERDIVRELARRGMECLALSVDEIMTRRIIGCTRTDTIKDVLERMTEGRFRHMPVMEGTEMVGLISIGDAVKARLAALKMEKDALTGMIMGN
ncbi:CBS domain-containing protein [Paenirhodobacter sp.]|jgi:CBS domain-containing protein|uniref:CBS domain-containing protein n=1 Tax=Paenirhodobacter sp. TaxID=1965326 RepID=UPI003B506B23